MVTAIIFIFFLVLFFKPLIRLTGKFLFLLFLPFLMIYNLFIPEKRGEVLKVLSIFLLPFFFLFLPFIVAFKKRQTQPGLAVGLTALWSLTYFVFIVIYVVS